MYHGIAAQAVLKKDTVDALVMTPVAMNGGNAAVIQCVCFELSSGADFDIKLQQSNDLENWSDVAGSTSNVDAPGYGSGSTLSGIAAAYVRAYCTWGTAASDDTAVFCAGINISTQ